MTKLICFRYAISALVFAGTALAAIPASAQFVDEPFTGARVGASIGFLDDDIFGTEVFTYGVDAGYDFRIGEGGIAGLTAELQDSKDFSRDLSVVGRLGVGNSSRVLGSGILLYALGGYTNLRVAGENLDGWRAGAGLEVAFGRGYVKLEQRYSDYGKLGEDEGNLNTWQTVLGGGFRF